MASFQNMFLFRTKGVLPRIVQRRAPSPAFRRRSSTTGSLSRCPTCSQPLSSNLPVCTRCWSIWPLPSNASHYDMFGLSAEPNPFLIHLPTLKKRFLEAQTACHPDAWASRPFKDQELSHVLSSRLNAAYQCLLHPLSRAEYILERNGVQISEGEPIDDSEFMGNIMEARETIDDAEERKRVEEVVESNQEHIGRTLEELRRYSEEKEWDKVKSRAIRLRYLEGIDRAAKAWLDNN